MSEQQEDLNAFNGWDCFGATLMLGIVPGVICYATTDPHDVKGAIAYCVMGLLISLVVLAVALITRWRILGKIINSAGTILTAVYIIYMASFWVTSCSDSAKEVNTPKEQTAQKTAP